MSIKPCPSLEASGESQKPIQFFCTALRPFFDSIGSLCFRFRSPFWLLFPVLLFLLSEERHSVENHPEGVTFLTEDVFGCLVGDDKIVVGGISSA